MMFLVISAGLGVLAILFRLAALARLTIPLLYTMSMLTVFHGWYQAHTALADNILFALHSGEAGRPRRHGVFCVPCPQGKRERRGHRQHRGPVALNQPRPISSRMIRSLILMAPTSTSILKMSSPT